MINYKHYTVNSVSDIYKIVGKDLLENGNIVNPRGLETKEIICPTIVLTNPKNKLAYNKDRKFNLMYALVESLMLFNEKQDVKYFTKFNSNMLNFSDDGTLLHGAYGHRIANSIKPLIEHLNNDKDTRQAVLTIYTNDFRIKTKDVPCTTNLFFNIRNNKLNMVTAMRSNDIIWGLPYDIFMFTNLQQIIANTLKVELGDYIHIPVSLHVYSQHYDLLRSMVNENENIEVDQKSDYEMFSKEAQDYLNLVDGYDITEDPDFKNQTFNILLNKEILFKNKDTSEKVWSLDNPIWANKFTKRWNK